MTSGGKLCCAAGGWSIQLLLGRENPNTEQYLRIGQDLANATIDRRAYFAVQNWVRVGGP